MKRSAHTKILTGLLFVLLFILVSSASADSGIWRSAPTNPRFLDFQRHAQISVFRATGPDGMSLGYRPSPLDLSHIVPPVNGIYAGSAAALPSRYDLRDHHAVTAVRDQNPYGTCWAFGALASLESTLKKNGAGDLDLSEWHLAYFTYVDENPSLPAFARDTLLPGEDPIFDQGGWGIKAAAILARWTGAVSESDRPYQNVSPWPESSRPKATDPVSWHLEHVHLLNLDKQFDGTAAKQAIMAHGALSMAFHWDSEYYNPLTRGYFNDDPSNNANHMVTLIGWNDDYPAANFTINPPGDGAWLLKNSWGTDFGDEGAFWISYHEPSILEPSLFIGAPKTNFDKIYQYDPLGWINAIGSGADTAWFANIFSAEGVASADKEGAGGREVLKAVSFYAAQSGSGYRIEIWKDVLEGAPRSGIRVNVTEGTLTAAGYHTVPLWSEVPLRAEERFSVVVRLKTPGFNWPIPVEQPVAGYSDKATANSGESFVSTDGNTWTDLTEIYRNTNVCLKAFTSVGTPVTGVTVSPESQALWLGQNFSLTATITPSDASDTTVNWSSSNPSVATVHPVASAAGEISSTAEAVVTAISVGHAVITATTSDGNFTGACEISVVTEGGGGCSVGSGTAIPALLLLVIPVVSLGKRIMK